MRVGVLDRTAPTKSAVAISSVAMALTASSANLAESVPRSGPTSLRASPTSPSVRTPRLLLKLRIPELHEQDFGIARTANGNFAIVQIAPGLTRVAAVEWDQP